jgi:hypothetical protein
MSLHRTLRSKSHRALKKAGWQKGAASASLLTDDAPLFSPEPKAACAAFFKIVIKESAKGIILWRVPTKSPTLPWIDRRPKSLSYLI